MKVRVDKSRGVETLMNEALTKVKPTESLRLVKQTECDARCSRVFHGNRHRNYRVRLIRI
jgi:hypothetical protein